MMGQKQDTIKKCKWKHISEKERYKIEALSQKGLTPYEISRELGRDRRTIEREMKKGKTELRDSLWREKIVYLADAGQRKHDEKASNKGRGLKIGHDHKLAQYLERKIGEEKWSPDTAINSIKAQGLQFEVTVCTKTVYNMIDRGDFLDLTNKDLPVKRNGKKRSYKRVRKVALNNVKGRSIEERPREAKSREQYGHWEMDCVTGRGRACLLVLTERMSRQEKIFKLKSKTQRCVLDVLDQLEKRHQSKFSTVFRSITMDNGGEFLDMQSIERSCLKSDTRRTVCYYAHPYSAWERGSNEVNNKLIRRFVPKGSNIDKLTAKDIKRIETWMNNYPRRMFGYKTANQMTE